MIYGISAYLVFMCAVAAFFGKLIKFGGSNSGRSEHTMRADHDGT